MAKSSLENGSMLPTKKPSKTELDYLKSSIENLEVKQIAESCVKVYSRRPIETQKRGSKVEYEYKMIFDESIRLPPLWIDQATLEFLHKNREEVTKKTKNAQKNPIRKKRDNKGYSKKIEDKNTEFGFCHQCKKSKPIMNLAQCSYNSANFGHAMPSFIKVKNIKAYNVEPYNTQAINYVIKTQLPSSKDKGGDKENAANSSVQDEEESQIETKAGPQNNENFEYHECNRMFCSFCLKYNYDLSLDDLEKHWLCPFCKGVCVCTRCSRQDQIVQMKALLFAEGGNLDNLYNSSNKIHHIIAENYCRSEKLMYDITDKNFRPPSPIRPVRRSPNLDFACKTTASVGPSPDPSHDDSDLQVLVAKRDELLSDLRSAVQISNQFSKSSLKALSAKPISSAKSSLVQESHGQTKARSRKETSRARKNAHKGNMKLRKKR